MSASYTAFKCFCPKKRHAYAIKIIGTLWNFTKHLHMNFPEPYCTRTLRNLTGYLDRNPPEPHRQSAPEPSGISRGICIGTLQNLTRYLHRDLQEPEPYRLSAPKPSGTQQVSAPEPSGTRNLVLNLHRIVRELLWAKDP